MHASNLAWLCLSACRYGCAHTGADRVFYEPSKELMKKMAHVSRAGAEMGVGDREDESEGQGSCMAIFAAGAST